MDLMDLQTVSFETTHHPKLLSTLDDCQRCLGETHAEIRQIRDGQRLKMTGHLGVLRSEKSRFPIITAVGGKNVFSD